MAGRRGFGEGGNTMSQLRRGSLLAILVVSAGIPRTVQGQAAPRPGEGRLELVEAVPRDDLASTVSAAISPDGRFLYSSAWSVASLTVFARDPQSGRLQHRQTVTSDT